MTFSIVGFDPVEKEWGVAVQSKFLGVGAVVPFAKAGVGAVATQSFANTSYGPKALELMEQGISAQEVMEMITKDDPQKGLRQVGIIDASGRSATFTGKSCYDWAGGMTGPHFAAQGNILVDEKTVQTMGEIFMNTKGPLAHRLLTALYAGQQAGGDKRGQQSAALLIVKEKGGYGGFNDRYLDLRVDDHSEPITELIRIYQLHQLYFAPAKQENIVTIEGDIKEELATELIRLRYLHPVYNDDELCQALTTYIHTENFEAREQTAGKIDLDLLEFMKKQI